MVFMEGINYWNRMSVVCWVLTLRWHWPIQACYYSLQAWKLHFSVWQGKSVCRVFTLHYCVFDNTCVPIFCLTKDCKVRIFPTQLIGVNRTLNNICTVKRYFEPSQFPFATFGYSLTTFLLMLWPVCVVWTSSPNHCYDEAETCSHRTMMTEHSLFVWSSSPKPFLCVAYYSAMFVQNWKKY